MRTIIIYFITISFAFKIISCSPSKNIIDSEITYEEISQSLKTNYEKIKSYSSTGKVDLDLNKLKMTVQFEIQVVKPSNAKIDLFGPFGFDIASVFLKNDSIYIYNAIENLIIKTSFSSEHFKNYELSEVISEIIYPSLLFYFDLNKIHADSTVYSSTKNKICVIKFLKDINLSVCYDKSELFLSEIDINKNSSRKDFVIRFKDLKRIDGIQFPMNIVIIDKNTQENISILFKKIEFNKIKDDLNFSIPENARFEEW